MATEFDEFIRRDLERQKGVFIPVKASILERLLVKNTSCDNMHPNENDEFTFPSVGPSYRIINEYMDSIRVQLRKGEPIFSEPIIVEKVRPKGYLILNGHHRWAASMKLSIKKVPIKIINIASDSDLKQMMEKSKHDKRVTLDLDEVVFRTEKDELIEKVPSFLVGKLSNIRIRFGIPGLFHYLTKNGYDIWVYSSKFYSIDDMKALFKRYSVNVDGIVTAIEKVNKNDTPAAREMKKLIENKYTQTLHIDNDMVLLTGRDEEGFRDFKIEGPEDKWSANVIEIIDSLNK